MLESGGKPEIGPDVTSRVVGGARRALFGSNVMTILVGLAACVS
jgi:hypothetical protein